MDPRHTTPAMLIRAVLIILRKISGPISNAKRDAHEDHRVYLYQANLPGVRRDFALEDIEGWQQLLTVLRQTGENLLAQLSDDASMLHQATSRWSSGAAESQEIDAVEAAGGFSREEARQQIEHLLAPMAADHFDYDCLKRTVAFLLKTDEWPDSRPWAAVGEFAFAAGGVLEDLFSLKITAKLENTATRWGSFCTHLKFAGYKLGARIAREPDAPRWPIRNSSEWLVARLHQHVSPTRLESVSAVARRLCVNPSPLLRALEAAGAVERDQEDRAVVAVGTLADILGVLALPLVERSWNKPAPAVSVPKIGRVAIVGSGPWNATNHRPSFYQGPNPFVVWEPTPALARAPAFAAAFAAFAHKTGPERASQVLGVELKHISLEVAKYAAVQLYQPELGNDFRLPFLRSVRAIKLASAEHRPWHQLCWEMFPA